MLSARGVTKAFGGVRAVDAVDMEVHAGEIHALVGENGAGKSTLIKIIAGALRPDAGVVTLDGSPLPSGDAPATRARGVSCVHQEFTLIPDLNVAENVVLGRERGVWLRRAETLRETQRQLDDLGVRIDPAARVRHLSVAHQQIVEIARALAGDASVLILDEPTTTLSPEDVANLFGVLRRLRARGLGIIYISHRLDEIFELADRVTVLRDGRRVSTSSVVELDRERLIRLMVGRNLSEEFPVRTGRRGPPLLQVEALAAPPRFDALTLDVHQGEIVGLAGLVGAGRTSVGLALAGALPASGRIRLRGRPIVVGAPREALQAGIAYVTEDRKGRGLFPYLSTGANATITSLSQFTRAGLLSRRREREAATTAVREFRVQPADPARRAGTLSGGNQQKLLLARYLLEPRSLLVLDEPTRGVDVGARAEIYRLMDRLTAGGLGILMISSDLNEVLGMSDRIVVMREGRQAGEISRADATAERVMALATGVAS